MKNLYSSSAHTLRHFEVRLVSEVESTQSHVRIATLGGADNRTCLQMGPTPMVAQGNALRTHCG